MVMEHLRVKEEESIWVEAKRLAEFVGRVFQKLNVPEAEARIAAEALVRADLRGVDSHGVAHVRLDGWYVPALLRGQTNPRPQVRVVRESPAVALVDGDGGLGMVVGYRAMEVAIRKAKEAGAALVTVRNSRHFGMAAYYSMMALEHDMIGIAMTNAGRQVVPTFGREAKYGTNPLSLAAPAREEPAFVLDMATSTVAGGKLEIAARLGVPMPLGWAADETGQPTADPEAALRARLMLPLGGTRELGSHKGYGLAMMVEILCGVLSGAGMFPALGALDRGHFFAAIDIAAFRPVAEFKGMMDEMLRNLKSTARAHGQERVYVAGEIEHELERERRAQGIPLHTSVVTALREVGEKLGVAFDL